MCAEDGATCSNLSETYDKENLSCLHFFSRVESFRREMRAVRWQFPCE